MRQVLLICSAISLFASCANDAPVTAIPDTPIKSVSIQNSRPDSAWFDSIIRDDNERRMHLLQSTSLLFSEAHDDISIIFLQTEVAGSYQVSIDTIEGPARIFRRDEYTKLGVSKDALGVCGAESEVAGELYYIIPTTRGIGLYVNTLTARNTTKHDWVFVKEFQFW